MEKKKIGQDSPKITNDDGFLGEILNDIKKARIKAKEADRMGLNVEETFSELEYLISELIDPNALN